MTHVGKAYLALGIAQTLHSMEEMTTHLYDFFWTATASLKRLIPFVPQFRMTPEVFAVLNMAIIALILASVPFADANRRWAVYLAWFWATIEMINGIGHLSGAIVFSGYIPGAFSAPFLLLTGVILLVQLSKQKIRKR